MTARMVDGRALAATLMDATAAEAAGLPRAPRLAVLTAGGGAADAYLRRIEQAAARAGVDLHRVHLDEAADAGAALAAVRALNADDAVDGILPLLPLPAAIADVAAALDPAKDVDGLTSANAGLLAQGLPGLAPCTPQAAIRLAEQIGGDLAGRTVTVVGASLTVGRPLAAMLLARDATVTVAHAATRDLPAACRSADVLFVAVGRPGLIGAGHLKAGAIVIDIGINAVDTPDGGTAIVGDVDPVGSAAVASAISAVPDGVGPLTAAFLIRNTVQAAQARGVAGSPADMRLRRG